MKPQSKDTPCKIALIITRIHLGEDYRLKCYRGVQAYARENSTVEVFINSWMISLRSPALTFRDLLDQGVKGFILAGEREDHAGAEELVKRRVPFVSLVEEDIPGAIRILSDHREAGRQAALYYLNRGFRSFGYVGMDNALMLDNHSSELREQGFRETLREHGYSCPVFKYALSHDANPRGDMKIAEELERWLLGLPRPSGVLAFNDLRGMHTLEACRRIGVQVPSELAVLAIDNNPFICESGVPTLSSVAVNEFRIGYEAAALLDRILHGKARVPSRPVLIPPLEVVTRTSSDIMAVDAPVVANALVFIQQNISTPFSVLEVSRHVGVSEGTLQTHFRKSLGCRTVHEVIMRMRLERARQLIENTALPMDTVAERCGMRRATYLTHVFKEKYGVTPAKWRKKGWE